MGITAGFFPNAARIQRGGDSYRTVKNNTTVHIHPSSVLMDSNPPIKMVLYYELVQTTKEYMRNCMPIKPEWLHEAAPHFHKKKDLDALEDKKKVLKDRYQVVAKLGYGASSTVWLCRDLRERSYRVIKAHVNTLKHNQ